ncbi:MAG: hypothetical protein R3277_08330 [Brumimicrobium sp.]|nr:hypothetical protein [Brumimicrobium sp.]
MRTKGLDLKNLIKYSVFSWIMLLSAITFGQPDSTKSYISDLYQSWLNTYYDYSFEHVSGKTDHMQALFEKQFDDSNRVRNFLAEFKSLESEFYKKDYGIGFNAGFLNNPTGGEQDFDNIIYRSRFISDIGWDILRSGYLHNRLKAQIAANESKIALIEDKELQKNARFAILWNYIIYQFNIQKIEILDERMKLAEDKIEVIKKLYLLNLVDQEELLKNLEALAEIRSMYKVYADFNEQLQQEYLFESTDTLELPLIDIQYSLIRDKLNGEQEDSIVFYLKENIDLENRFINEVSLRTSVRYSYYDLATITPSSRDFFSLGLTLGIPLNFNRKVKKEWIELQKESVSFIPEEERIALQKAILTNYYEYRYKLKQFTSMHYKRLMYEELLRKENARYSVDYLSFNPVSSLRILDDLMKIDIEMIDLKQQMYLKLIAIHADLPFTEIEDLYSIYIPENQDQKIYSSDRAIYIWDNIFAEKSLPFLISYMDKAEFERAVISFNNDSSHNNQKIKFIDTLSSGNIEIEIMTGRNSLIEEDPVPYFEKIFAGLDFTKISAVHLDVEPHTLADWDQKKKEYLDKYIDLLDKAKTYCEQRNVSLSVSVPVHYPEEYLQKIYEYADLVYFMAYENIKTDYILRKVKDFPENKTVIALRTEDFTNMLEIESKIIDLQEAYKPVFFAIHDLRRIIELEKK